MIGILGGGQLGMMLAEAGKQLGYSFRCYDPSPESPARNVTEFFCEDYHDFEALGRFSQGLDVVTYEFENVPFDCVEFLRQRVQVHPHPRALEIAQERLSEKTFFQQLGIPTPAFSTAWSSDELHNSVHTVGFPAMVKTCRFGYDGKGQFVVHTEDDVRAAWREIGGHLLVAETFVPFDRELSILAVRSTRGELAFYPLVQNTHREGILRVSIAPAPDVSDCLQKTAEEYATMIMEDLDYTGVLAVEFFLKGDRLIANEMAPRVHNSGHWTMEGAETSQFENHIRAITGMPLGSTAARGYSAMVNVIGEHPAEALSGIGNLHTHLYGKAPRPRRKLGHVTLVDEDRARLESRVAPVRDLLSG